MPTRSPLFVRIRTAFALAISALGLVAVGQAATASAATKVKTGPAGLAFYHPPKTLPGGHGSIIWARKTGGLVALKSAASTKLVLYTSVTPQGKRVAVSGTVSVPKGKAPKGGWPVITYAHGTTGVADICAPSRNSATDPATAYISYVYPQLNEWLQAGYAVVQTDYQGLGTPGPHQYLIGVSEGRSVLDIVTAAGQLDPSISKHFLIAGHSQGGQSALFAAGLAKSWTPKLKLRGTVAYAPANHILTEAKALPALTSPSSLSAEAALVVNGAALNSKQVDIPALLSDPALALYPEVNSLCLSGLSESDSFGGLAPSTLLRSGADTTALYAQLDKMNPLVTTSQPIYIAQGTADTTVFPFLTDSLNTELVGAGDKVTYTKYQDVTHSEIVGAAETDALAFFKKRLAPR